MKEGSFCPQRNCRSLFILLTPIIIVILIILTPWYYKIHFYNKIATDNINQIQRYYRINQELPALKAALENPQDNQAILSQYLTTTTPALAAATLQKEVKKLISDYGGTLESTQNMSNHRKTEGTVKKILIKVRMRGDIESLTNILYHLESSKPTLFIENLFLQKRAGRRYKAGLLSINFNLFGYMQVKS